MKDLWRRFLYFLFLGGAEESVVSVAAECVRFRVFFWAASVVVAIVESAMAAATVAATASAGVAIWCRHRSTFNRCGRRNWSSSSSNRLHIKRLGGLVIVVTVPSPVVAAATGAVTAATAGVTVKAGFVVVSS